MGREAGAKRGKASLRVGVDAAVTAECAGRLTRMTSRCRRPLLGDFIQTQQGGQRFFVSLTRLVQPFRVDSDFRQQESSFLPRSADPSYF
jgi:hypothetical protein